MKPITASAFTTISNTGSYSKNNSKLPVVEPKLNIAAGTTLSFRLENNQPAELAGEYLPESKMQLVDIAQENDHVRKVELAKVLLGQLDATDDVYYGDSESGHIASLSSVGKAEYAMHCLARDILRYEQLICGIAELKERDEKIMRQLEENRQKAVARQRMMEQLERQAMGVNQTSKALGYAQHLREMEAYGMSTLSAGPPPTTPIPPAQRSSSSNQFSLWSSQSSPTYITLPTSGSGHNLGSGSSPFPGYRHGSENQTSPSTTAHIKRKAETREEKQERKRRRKMQNKKSEEQESIGVTEQSVNERESHEALGTQTSPVNVNTLGMLIPFSLNTIRE